MRRVVATGGAGFFGAHVIGRVTDVSSSGRRRDVSERAVRLGLYYVNSANVRSSHWGCQIFALFQRSR